jgi:hypothetical protein
MSSAAVAPATPAQLTAVRIGPIDSTAVRTAPTRDSVGGDVSPDAQCPDARRDDLVGGDPGGLGVAVEGMPVRLVEVRHRRHGRHGWHDTRAPGLQQPGREILL